MGGSKGALFLDTSAAKEEVEVKPIEGQSAWESRRLWEKVAKGIRGGNYDEAGKEKTRIEVSSAPVQRCQELCSSMANPDVGACS